MQIGRHTIDVIPGLIGSILGNTNLEKKMVWVLE